MLVREIYAMTKPRLVASDLRFCGQVQAAAVSVMSNIAEGFERGGNREFRQFLFVATSSCAEVRSLLYVALDQGYVDDNGFDDLSKLAYDVGRVTTALRASLKV